MRGFQIDMRISKRRARKDALINGFRSNFEYEIAKYLDRNGVDFGYEELKLKYVVPETKRTYTPDWRINTDTSIVYESKGRFSSSDRKKMLLVRECNPNIIIRMIFQNPDVRISKASKTSYADWCDKNNIEWCDFRKGIPKGWMK
jgi:hypothetical protein